VVLGLRALLTHPNARVIGQNFAYDVQYIYRQWGFYPRLAFDTLLSHHVLWPGTDKDLATLSSLYCNYHTFWKHESQEADEREDDLGRWGYNCRDCVVTLEAAEEIARAVCFEGLTEQCKFQHKMWWHAVETMRVGVRTNAPTKKELSRVLFSEITSREAWLQNILGHDLNIRSPKQLSALFYSDLRCPEIKVRTKQGSRISTNEEALLQIALRVPLTRPLVQRILEVRSLGVFRSTFLESRLDVDGRIRCSYNVAGTDTFRFSSSQNAFGSGMNLQNVPKGNEDADLDELTLQLPNIRKLFLPDPGMEMFDMDLSSADLRIVVWESDEVELKQMLAAGLDPYTEIAKEFYNDRSITKRDPRRQLFKSFAHGTNYLGTARGLAKRLGLSVAQAERTQAWYFRRFPRIGRWQDHLKESVAAERLVTNKFGYRKYFFDRIDGQIFNRAAAWIPQSTVGLLINRVWDRVREEEPGITVLLQVHDSLVGQYPSSRAEYYRGRLLELSRIAVPYSDPLLIPTGIKVSTKSWGDVSDEALQ
jgi:DNA polymerase-1